MSADLLLPWPVVAAPVSAGATRKKLEIQTQLKVGIKQMSECLGDARYSKSIYALLSRSIVRSLLCYRVRDNDHCCVLCDVTRDLLFAKYIVHQPNVYQYGALIYPASVRQGLDYLPVNSKTTYPPGIPRAFFRTVGNLTQNLRPDLSGIDFQNVGQRFVQRVRHVQVLLASLLLYSLFCWSI